MSMSSIYDPKGEGKQLQTQFIGQRPYRSPGAAPTQRDFDKMLLGEAGSQSSLGFVSPMDPASTAKFRDAEALAESLGMTDDPKALPLDMNFRLKHAKHIRHDRELECLDVEVNTCAEGLKHLGVNLGKKWDEGVANFLKDLGNNISAQSKPKYDRFKVLNGLVFLFKFVREMLVPDLEKLGEAMVGGSPTLKPNYTNASRDLRTFNQILTRLMAKKHVEVKNSMSPDHPVLIDFLFRFESNNNIPVREQFQELIGYLLKHVEWALKCAIRLLGNFLRSSCFVYGTSERSNMLTRVLMMFEHPFHDIAVFSRYLGEIENAQKLMAHQTLFSSSVDRSQDLQRFSVLSIMENFLNEMAIPKLGEETADNDYYSIHYVMLCAEQFAHIHMHVFIMLNNEYIAAIKSRLAQYKNEVMASQGSISPRPKRQITMETGGRICGDKKDWRYDYGEKKRGKVYY